ncbi:hypothetical protein GUJ93_ZPchr0003g18178 [Zizania palustris]|uniref:Uncharacterized protein n=1 Tax=Zizania palustris TaxID=103762 RepID=A0A8J5S0R2_ZIZPA|nr:hypothetical protein GUJ93_ZPchr0003g18178 [Zizania palustris]
MSPRLRAASVPSCHLRAPWSPMRQAEEKEERAAIASARLPGFPPPPRAMEPHTTGGGEGGEGGHRLAFIIHYSRSGSSSEKTRGSRREDREGNV